MGDGDFVLVEKHLAELNIGRLVAHPTDPKVREFMQALETVNSIGKRSPGFVWIMEDDAGSGNTGTKIAGDPRLIPNLTVWEDVESLENFVFNTLHRRFFERREEWFEVLEDQHLVFWWVDIGQKPSIDEALERLDHLRTHGPSDFAFGWNELEGAKLYRDYARRT